jgi:hypothetical protein
MRRARVFRQRPLDRARRVLQEAQAIREIDVIPHDRHATDQVGMAAQVLGRRVHHDVGAELQRPRQHRRGEGVVHDQQRSVRVGRLGGRPDVDDFQHRVGRRLDPDQACLGAHGLLQRPRLLDGHEAEPQPGGSLPHPAEQSKGPAVQVVAGHHVRTAVQQLQQRCRRRHAGGKSKTTDAALEIGHALLVRVAGRIVAARVFPPLVFAGASLDVGRAREYRGHDGAGRGIRLLSGVDYPRGHRPALACPLAHWKSALRRR